MCQRIGGKRAGGDNDRASTWERGEFDTAQTEFALQQEALFDLVFDPNETNNLIGRPDMAGVAQNLRERLENWMRETGDPLFEGPVEAPKDAVANLADAVDPDTKTASSDYLETTYEW